MPTPLASRRVAVVGLGKSGLSVVRFCIERGAQVVACDDREEAALGSALLAQFAAVDGTAETCSRWTAQ
jgi:UDP-N-acetylmuramoylalanine-D-glutamate ligase